MIETSDIPGLGAVIGVAAGFGDLILNGGDVLISLFAFVLSTPDAWVTILSYTSRLAEYVEWIPAEAVDKALMVGIVLLIGVSIARFVRKWRSS